MYRIGDFSKIANLTIKALRYYDEQDILSPFFRAENGYRYYNDNDFKTAKLIILLRDLDFGIAEIKDVVATHEVESDLSYFLTAKKLMIEKRIRNDQKIIKKIESFIESKKFVQNPDYLIDIKEIAPIRVASKRFMGAYHETSTYQEEIFKEIKGQLNRPLFNCYHTSGYAKIADIEVCIPTNKYVNINGIKTKELPGIRAICTVHKGGYDCINYAYKAVLDFAIKNKIECGLPTREIYHKGSECLFMGNPNNFVTEILIPCGV